MQNNHNPEISEQHPNKIKQAFLSNDHTFVVNALGFLFFLGTCVYQFGFYSLWNMGGFVTQIQVFISIYLTIRSGKSGYITAIISNLILVAGLLISPFIPGNVYLQPGIMVPLSTIFIVFVIHSFIINYHHKIDEITLKNKNLSELNSYLTAAQAETEAQNKLLTDYNRIIKKNEEQLSSLAYLDILTELPNRKMLISRLDHLITSTEEPDVRFAVAFIDLDDFKQVNDTQGHHIGDLLLQAIATKLKEAIHPQDMLGRLGGDEFALIIKRPLNKEEIAAYVDKLRRLLITDLLIDNQKLSVHASFGIALYPQDGDTSAEILNCADQAMYAAKNHKAVGIEFFNENTQLGIPEKMDYEAHFNLALENDEFYLVFQPQYFSSTKRLRGFEILTRWYSPVLGDVSPDQFIPIAEKNGLMTLFGQWILNEACEKYKKIQELYPHDIIMSVNITSIELMDPAFVPMVKTILNTTGVAGKNIEFEISESAFLSSMNALTKILDSLKGLGIQIALDDFGNSIRYLNQLQKLPIDTVKIDKTYINDINDPEIRNHPVASMVSLGHAMNMSVLAKGVETNTQFDYLKKQHCDCIQGFLFGKPLKEITFHRLLEELILYKNEYHLINRQPQDSLTFLPIN